MQHEFTFRQFLGILSCFEGGHADLKHPETQEEIKVGISKVFRDGNNLKIKVWWIRVIRRGIYEEMPENTVESFDLGNLAAIEDGFEDLSKIRIKLGGGTVLFAPKPGQRFGPEICR